MEMEEAIAWAANRKHATLITIRRDGRPQSSDVVYALDDNTFVVSVTEDRAKTANMRRDPRVVLHISEPTTWSYLSFDCTVELSTVTRGPDDATSDALVAYYEEVAGKPHPDWDEYRQAMADERRLIARVISQSVVGQIH